MISEDMGLPDLSLLAYQAVRISYDIFGSDTLSAFENAKGYTKPIVRNDPPAAVCSGLIYSPQTVDIRRKFTLITRSKSVSEPFIAVGDMVQFF